MTGFRPHHTSHVGHWSQHVFSCCCCPHFLSSPLLTLITSPHPCPPLPTGLSPFPQTPNTVHRQWCVVTLLEATGDGGQPHQPQTGPTYPHAHHLGLTRTVSKGHPVLSGELDRKGEGALGALSPVRPLLAITPAAPLHGLAPARPGSWLPAGGWKCAGGPDRRGAQSAPCNFAHPC